MNEKYDIILVGGGISSLIVGTILQKKGYNILILEKEPLLGGKFSEINWQGVKFDRFGHWETIYGSSNPKDGTFYKACAQAGLNLDWQVVHWQVGLIKKGESRPEYHSISDWSGGKALLDFSSLMGLQIKEKQREELLSVLEKMISFSYEDLMAMTSISLEKWVNENIKDNIVKMFFNLGTIVTDIPAKLQGFSHSAWTNGNMYKGKSIFVTIKGGSLMKAVVKPLEKIALSQGVEIRTNTTVKEIVIKSNKVQGVWASDNLTHLSQKISAKNIILNVPVYEAYPTLLKTEMLTQGELIYVQKVIDTYTKDLSCYFLLEKDTIKELPGHFHGFDMTTGRPIYMGEICQQKYFGAEVPENFDYIQIYIPGGRSGFGYLNYKGSPYDISYELLDSVKNKMLQVVNDYMVPGFASKIIHSGIIWSPNFGRYCSMAFDSNLGVKSDKIEGLYFANDSVDCTCVGNLGLEKVGEITKRCLEKFL